MINHALAPGRPQDIEGTREFSCSARRDVHPAHWIESHVVAEGDLVVQFGGTPVDRALVAVVAECYVRGVGTRPVAHTPPHNPTHSATRGSRTGGSSTIGLRRGVSSA